MKNQIQGLQFQYISSLLEKPILKKAQTKHKGLNSKCNTFRPCYGHMLGGEGVFLLEGFEEDCTSCLLQHFCGFRTPENQSIG